MREYIVTNHIQLIHQYRSRLSEIIKPLDAGYLINLSSDGVPRGMVDKTTKQTQISRWSKGLSRWCSIPYHLLGEVERKKGFRLPALRQKIGQKSVDDLTNQDTIGMAGQVENLPRTAVLKLRRICRF
jgi:hypothetical protein